MITEKHKKEVLKKYGKDIFTRKLKPSDTKLVQSVLYDLCKTDDEYTGVQFIDECIDKGCCENATNENLKETLKKMFK